MMTELEIYNKALDGIYWDIDYLKGRCAKRYGKPGYEELVQKLEKNQEKYNWLQKKITERWCK